MQIHSSSLADAAAVAALPPVHLANVTAQQLAFLLTEPAPHLFVDCGGLVAPHLLGVCHFATRLLHLRQQGIRVWLCNAHPVALRCLNQLELGALFQLAE